MSAKKYTTLATVGLAALLASSASGALVNTLDVTNPTAQNVSTTELVGPESIIKVTMPDGLVGTAGLVDGDAINACRLEAVDSNGAFLAALDASLGIQNVSNGGNYNDAAGNTVEINLNSVTLGAFFTTTNLAAVKIYLTTNGQTITSNACVTRFNSSAETGALGTADECLTPDTDAPGISAIYLSGTDLFIVYDQVLSNNDTNNDDNQTDLADVNATDFQFNTSNSFTSATASPPALFTVSGSFTDGTSTTIEVDVTGNSSVIVGRFLRSKADNNGVPAIGATNDVRDVVGNRARQGNSFGDATSSNPITTGVVIGTLPVLTVSDIDWVTTVDAAGAFAEAIRVDYNLPLDSAGNLDFYGGSSTALVIGSSNTDSDIDLTAANIDADDPSIVLIDVDATGSDRVAPNGLLESADGSTSTGRFKITTIPDNTDGPSSIFSADSDYENAQNLNIGDAIAPSLASTDRVFLDQDGDGDQDAIAFVFDEPLSTSIPSSSTFTATVQSGITVHPFEQISAQTGELTSDTTAPDAGEEEITITAAVGDVDRNNDGEITADEDNCAIILSFNPDTFDWDGDETTGTNDSTEASPGTGDDSVISVDWDETGTISDTSSNDFSGSISDDVAGAAGDRAEAVLFRADFLNGENIDSTVDNTQLFSERDPLNDTTLLGDQLANNRLRLIFSEDLSDPSTYPNFNEDSVKFGTSGAAFEDGDPFFSNPSNQLTFRVDPNGNTIDNFDQFAAGTVITVSPVLANPTNQLRDANDVIIGFANQAAVDRTALYVANQLDVNGDVKRGAFLVDSDADGFVNQVRVKFTRSVAGSSVQAGDFSIDNGGTITAAAVDSSDTSIINLTVTDGVVPISAVVSLTYNGLADTTPLTSTNTGSGNGVSMAAEDDSIEVEQIATPETNTRDVAIMPVVGTITTNGSTPAPLGTKVYAMIAIPTVNSVTATHNNVAFTIKRGDRDESANFRSFEAWTNWWLGIERDLYLLRDSDNFQFYENTKFSDEDNDGNPESSVFDDAIKLVVNDRSITAVTFTGTGETSADKVASGSVGFCWDVLRSSDGTYDTLYRNGYSIEGRPILSSAVVTSSNGRYEMHVSAPISSFSGRTRFNAIGWPVILVVELPNGQRYVASSLVTSAGTNDPDGTGPGRAGDPLLFAANNRTQTAPDDASNARQFDINLTNIGSQQVFPEWNTVAFGRATGFARASNNLPVLPNGVTSTNVRVGSALPFVDPVDQYVWWKDASNDGLWTISDDDASGSFDSVVVDADCFSNFYFTMTSFGVQVGSGLTNLVGGYALGFYNNSGLDLGAFQFGAPLTGNAVFSPTFFPNNTTTQGWTLATVSAAFASGTAFGTSNSRADYIIVFDNNGDDGIQVQSLDIASPAGNDNPNDLGAITAGTAAFIHYTAN